MLGSYDNNGKLNASNVIGNIKKNIPGATIDKSEDFPLLITLDEVLYKIETSGNVEKAVITDRTGIKVGDYINYEPDATSQITYSKDNLAENITGSTNNTEDINRDNLKWQVLRIYEDGSMDLIGSPTTQNIYFRDATGYNNGVSVMHDICEKLYSRNGIQARSVTLEDMESYLTDEGKNAKNNDISNRISSLLANEHIEKTNKENGTITYKSESSYYPNLYANENGSGINTDIVKTQGIKDTSKVELDITLRPNSYKQANNLTATQTYYNLLIDSANYGVAAEILRNTTSFCWVASRYVSCNENVVGFGLRVASTNMDGYSMYHSSNGINGNSYGLRPVVYLSYKAQITTSETASEEVGTPHAIIQY